MIPDLSSKEVERFYSKVRLAGCGLTWDGGDLNSKGYGRFTVYRDNGKKRVRILAHRLAYKLFTGEDPGDRVVRHACDTPLCCTADCLSLGTQADNIHDAVERGRMNVSGLTAYRQARDANAATRDICGAWMPRSQTYCVKRPGHSYRHQAVFKRRKAA